MTRAGPTSCAECGAPIEQGSKATWCSDRCRWHAKNKRRPRKRKSERRPLEPAEFTRLYLAGWGMRRLSVHFSVGQRQLRKLRDQLGLPERTNRLLPSPRLEEAIERYRKGGITYKQAEAEYDLRSFELQGWFRRQAELGRIARGESRYKQDAATAAMREASKRLVAAYDARRARRLAAEPWLDVRAA